MVADVWWGEWWWPQHRVSRAGGCSNGSRHTSLGHGNNGGCVAGRRKKGISPNAVLAVQGGLADRGRADGDAAALLSSQCSDGDAVHNDLVQASVKPSLQALCTGKRGSVARGLRGGCEAMRFTANQLGTRHGVTGRSKARPRCHSSNSEVEALVTAPHHPFRVRASSRCEEGVRQQIAR